MAQFPEYIFNNLRTVELRLYAGISQKEVAEAMGLHPSAVSRFEHGRGKFNQHQISAYAQAINCHPGEFWTRIGTKETEYCG